MTTNKSQTVNITVPRALLKQVDALAKRDYTSRSDVIRQALLDKIRKNELDEWGDPIGEYKTLIDFREINPNGVPASQIIESIDKLTK